MRKSLRNFLLLAMTTPGSLLAAATVTTFTGGDPGEGLDMQGYFTYAVNVGPSGAAGKVGDANFTADDVAGVTISAGNNIANGGWGAVNYGDTENDQHLSFAMNSIRWSNAAGSPAVVTVKARIEKGVEYKLQLLFHEDCCPGRGFNVVINGTPEAQNFMPGPTQTGDGDFTELKNTIGSVITHQFVAASDELEIILDGPAADSPDITDRNAILNGFTLERISAVTDSDNDGLQDDWEQKFFSNLNASGTDDSDNDGLPNSEEQRLTTDPTKPDTDSDGLSDGDETAKYKTDPLKSDSDGDTLADGYEVNVLHTDPTKTDSDDDGVSDRDEVALSSDPADKNSKPVLTSLGVIKGGDAGEGLDLDGTFLYALAIGGAEDAAVQVRDAVFFPLTVDEVPGATLVAQNMISHWYNVNYGDTPNDAALALATSSIRWSAADAVDDPPNTTPQVMLTLDNLEVGAEYKVQLMFGEQCCNRAFDVLFDDAVVVKDFNPGVLQGGVNHGKQEALITRLHFAKSNQLVIRLDGRRASLAAGNDHNAILNAVTVEKIAGKTDTDNDGLPDEWEKLYFGNITPDGAADTDNDGLKNADEYAHGTDPTVADTDRDGLSDSEEVTAGSDPSSKDTDGDGLSDMDEVKTYKTDPKKSDTDGDGLSDGLEVNTYKTDPFKTDTDGDGKSDGVEISEGSDPTKAEKPTEFSNIVVQQFTGGDPGEGLDLQGTFLYAFNVSSAGASGKAGDADFTADNASGITVTAPSNAAPWSAPEYGDSPADDVIEKVTQSIRYGPNVRVELTGLIPESTYKVQLLFYEQCCAARGFNVFADGVLIAENFVPNEIQGGVANTAAGAVIAADFITHRDKLVIVLDTPSVTNPDLTDPNAILDGVTLEVLKQSSAATPAKISAVKMEANGFTMTFDAVSGRSYAIEYRESLGSGAWQSIADNVTAAGATVSYTDTNAERRSKPGGFYRVISK